MDNTGRCASEEAGDATRIPLVPEPDEIRWLSVSIRMASYGMPVG